MRLEHPQELRSPVVPILQVERRASRFERISPTDGAALGSGGLRLRWTLVPGASAYEVELESAEVRGVVARTTGARLRVTARERARWGSGNARWRVVPIFPGEVRGEPTSWGRVRLLPPAVDLELTVASDDSGSGLVARWSGGVEGMVYHLVAEGEARRALSVITRENEVRFLRGDLGAGARFRFAVEAFAPDGSSLGRSEWRSLDLGRAAPAGVPRPVAGATPVKVSEVAPAAGAVVASAHPRVGASWGPAVEPAAVRLSVDGADVTPTAEVGTDGLLWQPLCP